MTLIGDGGRRAGFSRGQAFEDFLTLVVCTLSGQTMEEEYLATVHKGYEKGSKGKRGIDSMTTAFAEMVNVMKDGFVDVLGDIFQGGITYGEAGQFFTPTAITDLMASLVTPDHVPRHLKDSQVAATSSPTQSKRQVSEADCANESNGLQAKPESPPKELKTVCDPSCGSGRILLSIAKEHPNWEFTGQDVDHRCAKMTAINLGLHGLNGWAVWQNSLTLETFRVYKTGFNLHGGVIKDVPMAASPFNYAAQAKIQPGNDATHAKKLQPELPIKNNTTDSQLDLF